jgi:hypothetical protein
MRLTILALTLFVLAGCQAGNVRDQGHVHHHGCGHYFWHGKWNSEPHSRLCSVAYWHDAANQQGNAPEEHKWDAIPKAPKLMIHAWRYGDDVKYSSPTVIVECEPQLQDARTVTLWAVYADGTTSQLGGAPCGDGQRVTIESTYDVFNVTEFQLRLIDSTGGVVVKVTRRATN